MPTEDKYIITIDATKAIKSTSDLEKKVEYAYGGIARLIGYTVNAKTGLSRYTIEVREATKQTGSLNLAVDTLNRKLKGVAEVSKITFKSGAPMIDALSPTSNKEQLPVNVGGNFGKRFPGAELIGNNGNVPAVAAAVGGFENEPRGKSRVGSRGLTPGVRRTANKELLTRNESIKEASSLNKAMFNIGKSIHTGDKAFRKLRMTVFITQMSMLGFAFSMQAITGTVQSMLMGALSGLADTESAVQNAVLSRVFGSDVAGSMGLGIEDIVESSLKAKGTLADLNSILVDISAKVLGDPDTIKQITSAIQLLSEKLSDPKLITAISSIVISVADMLPSLADVVPYLAEFVKWLGDSGLLPVIVLLIAACQILMPILAAIQGALMGLEIASAAYYVVLGLLATAAAAIGVSVGTLIAIFAALILIFDVVYNAVYHFLETGDVVGSIIYGLTTALQDLWGVISPIIDLIGGILGFDNASSGIASTVTNFIFNGNVSSDDSDKIARAVKDKTNKAY